MKAETVKKVREALELGVTMRPETGLDNYILANFKAALSALDADSQEAPEVATLLVDAEKALDNMLRCACWFHEGPYGATPSMDEYRLAQAIHHQLAAHNLATQNASQPSEREKALLEAMAENVVVCTEDGETWCRWCLGEQNEKGNAWIEANHGEDELTAAMFDHTPECPMAALPSTDGKERP